MTTITLNSILSRDQNNFDLIRVLAAISVIFGHAFALHPTGGWHEPVRQVFNFTYSGALAVDVFFFLSGILITSSFCQTRSTLRFILMRIARIWPGLILCLFFSTLFVGLLTTTIPALDYLAAWQTRWYILTNIQLNKITYTLPGVFENNHYKGAVNGSLWTLPIEIRCYLMVFLFGIAGGFRSALWGICLAIALGFLAATHVSVFQYFRVYNASEVRMPLIFALGMLCYTSAKYIRIDWRLSVVAILLAIFFQSTLLGIAALYFFVLNTVLVLGCAGLLRRFKLPGDYSYGLYIYGFVVQQCVAHFLPQVTSYFSLLLTLPITFTLAVLSWHCVEQPSLNLARLISTRYEMKFGLR